MSRPAPGWWIVPAFVLSIAFWVGLSSLIL